MKSIILFLFPFIVQAQNNTVELGDVHWLRSFDEAQTRSKKEGKSILILFQEIPGCATCRNYGSDVLTHPLIVEAIETEFIPLAIHNNKGGHDAEILKRYQEPAWNNPVVRVVDSEGSNILPRLSGNYSAAGLTALMTNALIKQKGKAPMYLQLLTDELSAQQKTISKATYSMYCFWTGEALFGKLNGVIRTTAGFEGGKEVVVVEYNPSIISKTELDKIAQSQKCVVSGGGSFRADATPKYYLSNSEYRVVPMTEIQKCRVNSALAEKQDPGAFLSARQIAFLKTSSRNCVSISLKDCW
ncbi:MAG TPA: VPGUxxT family thioredoxin-like (seleno)protein, type 2 [Saprospiraceae bacterium]|nr:VPGUxxT family thioredoxin-like (seleno)protein, type 2 [Saprospiraceae bacterium]